MRYLSLLLVVVLLGSARAADDGPLPLGTTQFWIEPDVPVSLRWSVVGDWPADAVCVARDYQGREAGRFPALRDEDGVLRVEVRLPQGAYDLELPGEARFGLAVMPPCARNDPFFAIDSALSWLVGPDSAREDLVAVLQRAGIGMSRERLTWGAIHPAADRWDWETPRRFEKLRVHYAAHDVAILEMFHDAPAWTTPVGKYPGDLVVAAESWEEIARRWRPRWGALELWNEPDIFFGGLPADQYVSVVKAVRSGVRRASEDLPILGGALAHFDRPFVDNAAANGLLDQIDVLSFHTYGRALQMESLVDHYRGWLVAQQHPHLPLWITECGRPWSRGPGRPPVDQDAASALDIVMKAVEARACGVARYFAFVYPYYEERENNFGMMDRRGTPLRAMAAYARLAALLAGKTYVGDLPTTSPELQRVRVFASADEAVAVLYTGRPDASVAVALPLAARRLEGIDGRTLTVNREARVPVPDGLTYAWLDPSALDGHLQRDTRAMRLRELSATAPPARAAASTLVMRYEFDRAAVSPEGHGYRVLGENAAALPLRVRLFNLGPETERVAVRMEAGEERTSAAPTEIDVPGQGSAVVASNVALTPLLAARGEGEICFEARSGAGELRDRLTIRLLGEPDMRAILERRPGHVRLPLEDLARWREAISRNGAMKMARTEEDHWRLEATFSEGDRWVYPRFTLPEGTDLSRHVALVARLRAERAGQVRMFLWEDANVGYLTPGSMVPADGRWHTVVIPLAQLELSSANAPDPNGRLDLAEVRAISLGMNSQDPTNVLEASELYLVPAE